MVNPWKPMESKPTKPNTVEPRSPEDILEPQGRVEGSRDCKRKAKKGKLRFPLKVYGCFRKIMVPAKWMVYNGKPY